jgi:hypothetical protein
MLGYTDLLRSGHPGPVNGKQKQMLEEIRESDQRLQSWEREVNFPFCYRSQGRGRKRDKRAKYSARRR